MAIGLGIVGSGYMGTTYSETISRYVRGARLVAVTGGRRSADLGRDFSVDTASSPEELFARADIQAVILATPDHSRRELTMAAAAAGKHVLAEKPMAPTVADCDAMIAACQAAGVHLAVVKTERYRKLALRTKKLIDDGAIGPVRMVRTVSSLPITVARELLESRPWISHPTGGGLFLGMATHNTDFLRWITGGNATKVFAEVHTYCDLPIPAMSVMAQIVFDNGSMGQLWVSSELPSPGVPSSEVRFQIVGRDGTLDLENFEFLDQGKGEHWERISTPEQLDDISAHRSPIRLFPHVGVVQDFVDSILEQRPPAVTGLDGRAAVEICEACLISARTGQAVDLPLTSPVIG
ncbi:MAG: Gfo/Idh/MocA family oxidoreductase [Planctomycetes bacterium]|nr:Gfo/Idh/MocA family oxidoreductase [Planctomycetota bacterium]